MADKIKGDTYFVIECIVLLKQLKARRRHSVVYDRGGFTLVELIVVTAVLAILVMMALPAYNEFVTSAKNKACASDIRTIDGAIQAYIIEKSTLPGGLVDVGMGDKLDPWKHPYEFKNLSDVANVPLEDSGGVILNKSLDYDLYSKGADGASSPGFGDHANADDIVRSNDGAFVGMRP